MSITETPDFDPRRIAESVYEGIERRFPASITAQDALQVVEELSKGAIITTFITPLAHKQLTDRAMNNSKETKT